MFFPEAALYITAMFVVRVGVSVVVFHVRMLPDNPGELHHVNTY